MQIDSLQQWAGNFSSIPVKGSFAAGALALGMSVISAETGIHRRDKHKRSRKFYSHFRSGNKNLSFFEWLSKRFYRCSFAFPQLIKKKYSIVSKRNFSGYRAASSANQGNITRSMVRITKWSYCN